MGIKEIGKPIWHWLERKHLAEWLALKWIHYGELSVFLAIPGFVFAAFVGLIAIAMNNLLAALVGAPVAGFFFVLLVAKLMKLRSPKPDFNVAAWGTHPIYSVWVAACLWVDMKPWPSIDADSPAYEPLQKIKAAIQAGQIHTLTGNGDMKSQVTREELIRLADFHSEKPRFLFG